MNRGSEGIYGAWIFTSLISCKHDESSSSGESHHFNENATYNPNIDICIVYTPKLGLTIADVGQEREQSRFRGSMEGAWREQRGAPGEHVRA